jgi:hypothetical protein
LFLPAKISVNPRCAQNRYGFVAGNLQEQNISMKKLLFIFCFCVFGKWAPAQKIDSIYFHLFYNYINVDGKTSSGTWLPLTADEISFSTAHDTCLKFQNNDLFIDSAYKKDYVTVKAVLKSNPKIWKEVTIYIRKRGFDEPLKTNEQVLEEYHKQPARKKSN